MTAQPPFSALRILEAASRHRSYTWAAKELNVTHSAISQSIRRLEATFGTTLFERRGGAMEPSDAALKLAHSYSHAAMALELAIQEVRGGAETTTLAVNMPASFGSGWFVGKLARLARAAPDINVEISTTPSAAFDLQIGYSSAPPSSAIVLAPVTLFPVRARRPGRGPNSADDLVDVFATPFMVEAASAWRVWARRFPSEAAGLQPITFDDPAMLLEAAAQDAGVALAHLFVAEAHLDAERLEALPFAAGGGTSLILQSAKPVGKGAAIDRLVHWMRSEIAQSVARLEARLAGYRT